MTDLFNSPALRVEQPRKVVQTQTQYNILDGDGELLAVATDTAPLSRAKAVRAALPGNVLAGPRTLLVRDPDDVSLLVIEAQENKRLTLVRDQDGELIGSIQAERTTRHYSLLDAEGGKLGEVIGDLGLRKFEIKDVGKRPVARVTKKWAGLRAEVFTTADRYSVEFTGQVTGPLRTLVVVMAIVIDLTLHESKDVV